MKLTFYGGAGAVTGSKHLLETASARLLLDCGTFQGLPDVRERNRSVPFPPESIDHVILSHAHVDHCGMLPLLVKRGFTGTIISTPATRDVAKYMLLDAASIETQDAEYRTKHKIGAPDDREPLFVEADIAPTMAAFTTVPYARHQAAWHDVAPGVRLKFYDAGHILGSSVTVLEISEGDTVRYLAYTGDMGPPGLPLLHDPELPTEPIDTIITESTYGGRIHEPLPQALDRLATAITDVVERRGKIIIPAFALGRTQALIYLLHKLTDEDKIPRLPVIVDSPLATNLTAVFRAHEQEYDHESTTDFNGRDHKPLAFRNLTYTPSVRASKELNHKPGPYIIISASGMMTAGRVIHHLRHSISDARNALFITGYQAAGTLGRRLLEGAERVELYGDWFDVRAEVKVFNEFSAHADQTNLINYVEQLPHLKQAILVHGESEQAAILQAKLKQRHPEWQVTYPQEGDTLTL